MPTFNVYRDLIVKVIEALQADVLFEGVHIWYDRNPVSREEMPAINVFLEQPSEDIGRGSGAYSLQSGKLTISIGFGIWACGGDAAIVAETLWEMAGNLRDWLRNHVDLDRTIGVGLDVSRPIRFEYVSFGAESSGIVDSIRVSATFQMFTGPGPA